MARRRQMGSLPDDIMVDHRSVPVLALWQDILSVHKGSPRVAIRGFRANDDPLPFLLLQTSRAFHTSRLLVHSSFFCGHPRWFSRFWDSAPTGSWWARRLALAVLD